jgi:hypothetical protein
VSDEDRLCDPLARPQRLDQVGLLAQRVAVLERLRRCAETEEVGISSVFRSASAGASPDQS